MDTVLITGANRGLGEALVQEFSEHDYNVIVHSRQTLDGVWPGLEKITGDLRFPAVISEIGRVALERGVSILINNAGTYINKPFDKMMSNEFRKVIETNLIAPILVTQAVWPAFWSVGTGIVVNINSLAGQAGGNGEAAYAASKHGLAGFSKALQYDGTRDNVRVINMFLGALRTDMTRGRPDHDKFIDPFEVADLIVRLCKNYKTLRVTDLTVARSIY